MDSSFSRVQQQKISALDLLGCENVAEKLVQLLADGVPSYIKGEAARDLDALYQELDGLDVSGARLVVFGGGSGLATIVGGSSRLPAWERESFSGIKELFPWTRSVVCVTDDGGSTGELLKDVPLIALGDIRHVLLSSIQLKDVQYRYQIPVAEAQDFAGRLSRILNRRTILKVDKDFIHDPDFLGLPDELQRYLLELYHWLFRDIRLAGVLERLHCYGNLFIVAAIFRRIPDSSDLKALETCDLIHGVIREALNEIGGMIGAVPDAVLPCTSVPCQLRARYANGVVISGEEKMSSSNRGYAIDSIEVDFVSDPHVYDVVLDNIAKADMLIFAPGSLYSSIIPVLKIPQIAAAVRANSRAFKLLVSNLWVQAGETDRALLDPSRKFRVSDMLRAYESALPAGAAGLFDFVVSLGLDTVPASVLQDYALEGKIPIYLDRAVVEDMGYKTVQCGLYSRQILRDEGFIQHDPNALARAVATLYAAHKANYLPPAEHRKFVKPPFCQPVSFLSLTPAHRYSQFCQRIDALTIINGTAHEVRALLKDIVWKHRDIALAHLATVASVEIVDCELWCRDQRWDNVFSFYDPEQRTIKIRGDQLVDPSKFELAFLVAVGESLLGNYACDKRMEDVEVNGIVLGQVYRLTLSSSKQRHCYFSAADLAEWMRLSRMNNSAELGCYLRLINAGEMFTPPGLLLGLTYAWYLDNRLATHIDYKMTIMKVPSTNLILAQKTTYSKRRETIDFLRDVVFFPH